MHRTVVVDDALLARAQQLLGTSSAEETVEVSLRRTIGASPAAPLPPIRLTTDAEWEAFRRRLRTPPSQDEVARRRASFEAMERVRVKVGREFNVAQVIRELRDRAAEGRPEPEYAER